MPIHTLGLGEAGCEAGRTGRDGRRRDGRRGDWWRQDVRRWDVRRAGREDVRGMGVGRRDGRRRDGRRAGREVAGREEAGWGGWSGRRRRYVKGRGRGVLRLTRRTKGTGVGKERTLWVVPQDGTEELWSSRGANKFINTERRVESSPPV